jgi:hypothetical protein
MPLWELRIQAQNAVEAIMRITPGYRLPDYKPFFPEGEIKVQVI